MNGFNFNVWHKGMREKKLIFSMKKRSIRCSAAVFCAKNVCRWLNDAYFSSSAVMFSSSRPS